MSEREPLAEGSYRLFKQGGGKTAFAEVHVVLKPSGNSRGAVVSVTDDVSASIESSGDAVWLEAAIAGCQQALSLLGRPTADTEQQVVVTRLVTNLVDTTSDAVWTAAAKATADALGEADRLGVVFRDAWTVELVQVSR